MPYKLLIVDDETELTDYLRQYFELRGFAVFTSPSGEDAVSILQKEKPDAAIVDILLKTRLGGMDVLRQAKKVSPATKMIILTGFDARAKEQEARKIGVCRYLRKPITVKELECVIKEALGEK